MVSRIFIFLLFAVLGCHAQYENHRSSDLKQRNKAARGSDRDELSNSRQMRKREMDSESMYHNCFVSKGCFGYPSGCISRSDCEVFLTFKNDEKGVTFQMKGALDPENYMAMGLSMDSQMGDDAVTECFRQGSKVMVRESWNDGKSNANTRELLESSYDGEFKDGMVTCTWTEDYNKVSNGKRFQLDQNNYHLLLAKGAMRDNRMGYHFAAKIASQESVNFTAFDLIAGEGVSDAIKIHGTFMVTAWVGFVSIAILLARHFKSAWETDTICGVKIWFALHRGFMIIALVFVVIAFIVIFVHKNGWNYETSNPHAILGCIATALGLFQPIMAAFRPSPDSPKRPIFNWLHFLVGNFAQLFAVITIFFAVSLGSSNLEQNFYYVMGIFVGVYLLFHFLFQMQAWTMSKKKNEVKMVEMTSRVGNDKQNTATEKHLGHNVFKILLLGVFSIFLVIILLTLYSLIGIA